MEVLFQVFVCITHYHPVLWESLVIDVGDPGIVLDRGYLVLVAPEGAVAADAREEVEYFHLLVFSSFPAVVLPKIPL